MTIYLDLEDDFSKWRSEEQDKHREQLRESLRGTIQEGLFAKSPDPIVFGPDVLVPYELGWLDNPHNSYRDCYYIKEYDVGEYYYLKTKI